jgi:peptide/nickel transport system substrate-binding protein
MALPMIVTTRAVESLRAHRRPPLRFADGRGDALFIESGAQDMTRWFGVVVAGLLASTTLGGLSAQAATPRDTLVIATAIDDIVNLDPAELFEFSGSDVANNIYNTILELDPYNLDKGYQPGIAESWTVSADSLNYTFKIRQGVKFHSGNPLTAADVVFSLHRAVILKKTPSFILTQFGFNADNVKQRIRQTGPFEVQIAVDKPYAPSFLLNCLTANIASVVDMKTAMANEKAGDMGYEWLKTNSAGSGPYRLRQWKASDNYTLEKAEGYAFMQGKWQTVDAPIKRIIARHVPEAASQRLLLQKGDVDVARNFGPDDIEAARKDANLRVAEDLKGYIWYFSANMKHPVLSKPEVLEAMKYLIDYDTMRQTILRGTVVVHQAFLPRTFLGAIDDAPYRLDVDKAKALLAKAGHANGFNITMDVRSISPVMDMAQAIQATFAKGGIKMEIIPGDGRQTLTKYRARNHDLYIGRWGPDYPDPHTNADTFARNPNNAQEANLTGLLTWRNAWAIPEMTRATDAAVLEKDNAKRVQMYGEIQRDHQRSSPFMIMFQHVMLTAARKNVSGLLTGGPTSDVYYYTVKK